LMGENGDDQLEGGAGNDSLDGGAGSDLYLFGSGSGQDTISNYDANAADIDVAHFDNASIEDLWFTQSGNNLVISRVGSLDKVTVSNWYSGSAYQLDKIEAGSSFLLTAQVQQLVTAMASFTPPVGVGSILTQDVKDQLYPVLVSAWQGS
jgi:Ca2+-binding RTX toxin-like protein